MNEEELVPMDETEGGGFSVVLRGYDRREVEDYIKRVELALGDADRSRHEDAAQLAALAEEVATLRLSLGEAERRAAGLPESATQIGDRLASMLRLAEQEAEEIVAQARDRAERSSAERNAELESREASIAGASGAAEQTRMEAQHDAQALRERAQQEAEELTREAQRRADELLGSAQEESQRRLHTAEEDIAILHEEARAREQRALETAQAQVDDLARQRDAIAAQLEELRRTLSAAVKPLGVPEP